MSINLLLVDDSQAMRSFIRRVIDLSGVDVASCHEASNGSEALAVLDQQQIDLVLCDINMPVMDGEEFLRRLSEAGKAGSPPVVIVSTDATSVRMQRVSNLGAKGYMTKPFSPEKMREVLTEVLTPADGESLRTS